jgi:hypothetical protein
MNTSKRVNSARSVAWLAGAALASAAMLGPAHAGEQYPGNYPSGGSGMRQPLDSNKDGRVSRTEAQHDAALRERFDALDANRDGTLDAAELAAQDNQAAAGGTEVKQ